MGRLMPRNQVADELKWNLADIYPTKAAWEADVAGVEKELGDLARYRGRLGESGATLLACLAELDTTEAKALRAVAYGSLEASADGTSTEGQAMGGVSNRVGVRLRSAKALIESELARFTPETLDRFCKDEPGLADYKPYFNQITGQAAHTLSQEAEQAVAALSGALSTPQTAYQRILFADARFEPITDRNGEPYRVGPDIGYRTTGRIPDGATRAKAAASLAAGLEQHRNGMAAALADHVRNQVALARLRGYSSAEEMLLAQDQVDPAIYRNFLDTLRAELPGPLQRWARLRAKVKGTEQVHLHDLWAPLDEEPMPPLSPAAGASLIQESLAPLGAEYGRVVAQSFRDRWVDFADNVGKPAVQFAYPVPGVHPYILTAWQNTFANARGVAHEVGHAVHGVLAERNQPFRTRRYGKTFVEAPSTANELLVGYHLLQKADNPRLRREALHLFLTTYHGMMVLIGGLADFEHRLFAATEAGEQITADKMMAMLADVWRHYFGDTLVIEPSALYEWMLWPQFYNSLYLWVYPTGLCCAYQVIQQIRAEGPAAAERWIDVLKLGGSIPSVDLMTRAGVDIVSPATVRDCIKGFDGFVGELERCYE